MARPFLFHPGPGAPCLALPDTAGCVIQETRHPLPPPPPAPHHERGSPETAAPGNTTGRAEFPRPSITPSPCWPGNQPPFTPDALGGLTAGSLAGAQATDAHTPSRVSGGSSLGAAVCRLALTPAAKSADSSQLSLCSQPLSLAGESCLVQGQLSFQLLVNEGGAASWPPCLWADDFEESSQL